MQDEPYGVYGIWTRFLLTRCQCVTLRTPTHGEAQINAHLCQWYLISQHLKDPADNREHYTPNYTRIYTGAIEVTLWVAQHWCCISRWFRSMTSTSNKTKKHLLSFLSLTRCLNLSLSVCLSLLYVSLCHSLSLSPMSLSRSLSLSPMSLSRFLSLSLSRVPLSHWLSFFHVSLFYG